MGGNKKPSYTLLEYGSNELLNQSIKDRERRVLFFPAVARMRAGELVDVQVTVEHSAVLFPIKVQVLEVRERPEGEDRPRGVVLQVIEADRSRFDRLCAFVDGMWQPSARRAAPRYPVEMRASYYFPPRHYWGKTADLSVKGLFLRTDGPLPDPGTRLEVLLKPSLFRSAIELVAQVRWIDKVENRRGMGFLCEGPPEGLARLEEIVADLVKQTRA